MPAIFISHSSSDLEPSGRIKAWLGSLGYEEIFLDFDTETGLGAGEDWERRLYQEIERCHAAVIVVTPAWMASKWCFAEFITARAQGKTIVPVICAPGVDQFVAPEIQCIDLQGWKADKLAHLEARLRAITEDLARGFTWPSGRPPYTGLESFDVDDAAIFFGRDQEIQAILSWLNARRVLGGEQRLLLVHGASGSGKSSLLKAGVLPQLGRARQHWIVFPTMRPEQRPLVAFAKVLAHVEGRPQDYASWHDDLKSGRALARIVTLLDRLRSGASREATIVIAFDQFEELFTIADADERRLLLELLAALFDPARALALLMIATARSDLIFSLLVAQPLKIAYRDFPLDPMPVDRVPKLIAEPARVAGLSLERGLVETIARDVRRPEELPLLAFTLRDLYDRTAGARRLTIAGYNALGDASKTLDPIANAVSRRSADMMIELRPSDTELEGLRDSFIPHLVRLRGEDNIGTWVRHPAKLEELPPNGRRLIKGFVAARLLVERAGEGDDLNVEVAHEALFTAWPLLAGWLDDERAFLSDLERMWAARRIWLDAAESDRGSARLGDYLLARARNWVSRYPQRFQSGEFASLRAFVETSAAAADRSAAEQRRRDRRAVFWRRVGVVTAVAIAFVASLSTWFVARSNQALQRQTAIAEDNLSSAFVALSTVSLETDPVEATKLALAALSREDGGAPPRAVLDNLSAAVLRLRERKVFSAGGRVTSVSFSPDGRRVMASAGHVVKIWDVLTGEQLGTLDRDPSPIESASLSPDGRSIVTAHDDSLAMVWDATTFEWKGNLAKHSTDLSFAAFSPDGTKIVTASNDRTVRIWNARTGQPIEPELPSTDGIVRNATFAPDGIHLVTVSVRRIARLWALGPPASSQVLGEAKPSVFSGEDLLEDRLAAFSPDGTRIVTASADDAARIWDATSRSELHLLKHSGPVTSVAFSLDGRRIVTASADRIARIWDASDGELLAKMAGHKAAIASAAFSHDGRRVVTASADGTARVWDAATGTEIVSLIGHRRGVTSASFSPDDTSVVSASQDETVRIWDVRMETEAVSFASGGSEAVAFAPDGLHVAIAAADSRVRIWSTEAKASPLSLDAQAGPARSLAFSRDGAQLVVGYDDGTARIWHPKSNASAQVLAGHHLAVNRVDVSPDGAKIVTASKDGTAIVWNSADGTRLAKLDNRTGAVRSAVFSPDGAKIITTDKQVQVWDAATYGHLQTLRGHAFLVADAAFSPDGRLLLTASLDRTAILRDGRTFATIATLHHASEVKRAVFSPDGTRIATASNDKVVRLWDAATGEELVALGSRTQTFVDVAFSLDGRRLAAAASDGIARLWDISALPKGDIVRVACAWLPDRNLERLRKYAAASPRRICSSAAR